MSAGNFVCDSDGHLIENRSKNLKISYDWRGMPTEFVRKIGCYDYHGVALCDSTKLEIKYDGSGRRISKTRLRRDLGASDWAVENVTHYTGIGTEVRETHVNGQEETKVVVNLPEGLGRYTPEDAEKTALSTATRDENGRPTSWSVFNPKFEWYLKNHLGSTMLVYGTSAYDDSYFSSYKGGVKAAYDYRAFGEQVTFTEPTDKVTENFTGKEKDDETELNYFGARYLDPMLGMWTSVDAKRQYDSPYTYADNNPIIVTDPDGNSGVLATALFTTGIAFAVYKVLDVFENLRDMKTTNETLNQNRTSLSAPMTKEQQEEFYTIGKKTVNIAADGMSVGAGGASLGGTSVAKHLPTFQDKASQIADDVMDGLGTIKESIEKAYDAYKEKWNGNSETNKDVQTKD